jgi:hypothetical protein
MRRPAARFNYTVGKTWTCWALTMCGKSARTVRQPIYAGALR